MKFRDINIRELQVKKTVYTLMIVIFLVCLAVCVSIPINGSDPDFANNLYFIPILGVVGALLFRKKWFITPIIVFAFSAVSFAIQFGDAIFTIQLSLCYVALSLIGCLIAVLLRFAILKNEQKKSSAILRILSASMAVVMIGGVLSFANSVAGNPISKAIARSRLNQYLNEVYPEAVIQNDVFYNFIAADYELEFYLDGKQRYISYSHHQIRDVYVAESFEQKFAKDFALIKKSIETDTIDISAFIATSVDIYGEYKTDMEKSTNNILYLSIKCTDSDISEEESKKTAAKVTMQVLDALKDSYNISTVDVVYSDNFDTYTITSGEAFTVESLLSNTQKMLYN